MFTRYSKRVYLLFLITSACGVLLCRSSPAAVIEADFNLPIPAPDDPCSEFTRGRMDDALINVREHILINDLDVAVSLTHGAFMDLEIVLENPGGTVITLNPSANTAFWIGGPGGGRSAGV
jgi:hypothetical protein